MKRAYIAVILFYVIFHFIIPLVGYQIWGYINLYANYEGYIGMTLNIVPLLFVCLIIWKRNTLEYNSYKFYDTVTIYFIVSLMISILKFILSGGYEGALSGEGNGSILSFMSLFFSIDKAFIFLICFKKDLSRIGFWFLVYIISLTLLGSRSAIIGVLLAVIYLSLFPRFHQIFHKIKRYLLIFGVVSPFLFYIASSQRGDFDVDMLGKVILGRVSFIGLSQVPISSSLSNDIDQNLFNMKYGITNQIKQSLNSITPIDFYEYDVSPNQYYRQVFLGARDRTDLDAYLSINLTFPIYLVLISNTFWGILLTVVILVFLFNFWVKHRNNQYLFFSILFCLYEVLYFFDLVMIIQNVFRTCLSLLTLNCFEKLYLILRYNYNKYLFK